jgi:2-polyprenyl-3-methyl-5-hydroxy-6-metoxy-1,4-benzoquinol methylase
MHNKLRCVVCESDKVKLLPFRIGISNPVFLCRECGLKYIKSNSYENLADDNYWDEVNKKIYAMPSVIREMTSKHFKFLKIIKNSPPPNDKLLDVGCGNGIFLDSSKKFGFTPEGIEPNPVAIDLCRKLYAFSPHRGFLTMDSNLPKNFGVLTAWDVIEHVSDPRIFLETCHAHLQNNGILLLETPDESCFIRKLIYILITIPIGINRDGLRKKIYYLSHRYYFTRKSIAILLKNVGFRNISIYSGHSIFSKSLAKIQLYRKYSNAQMIKYKAIFTLLKAPLLSNKQIVIAQKI